jgi:hypothetical protein
LNTIKLFSRKKRQFLRSQTAGSPKISFEEGIQGV